MIHLLFFKLPLGLPILFMYGETDCMITDEYKGK